MNKFLASLLTTGILVPITSVSAVNAETKNLETEKVPILFRPLLGSVNKNLVFNSNSPEVVLREGILLSTLSPKGKKSPGAHLNYKFRGDFDLFAHHIARAESSEDKRTLYLGILVFNEERKPVSVSILHGSSYLSQPDAPFIKTRELENNDNGRIFSGPGDRLCLDLLQGKDKDKMPLSLRIEPSNYALLLSQSIPVNGLEPPLNGRSLYYRCRSSGKVRLASLAMLLNPDLPPPSLSEWQHLAENGDLVHPRDKTPSKPDTKGPIIFGRVAAVQEGNRWETALGEPTIPITEQWQDRAYPLSTVTGGTFGTNQIQSAKLLVRYPDTAYAAHGNYCLEYKLRLPFVNERSKPVRIELSLDSPLKTNQSEPFLTFYKHPPERIFFRGSLELTYDKDLSSQQIKAHKGKKEYFHICLKQGEKGKAFASMVLNSGERQDLTIILIYPPDCTPPQVLRISVQPIS